MDKNQVTLVFAGDSKKLENSFHRSSQAGQKFESDIGRVSKRSVASGVAIGTAFYNMSLTVARSMFNAVKSSIDAASDLAETQSKVKVIFGQSAAAIETFAATADRALGQSKQQAMDAAATFAIFGKSAGLSGQGLVQFSTKMVTLAGDLASFSNTSPEDAIVAISAALRGESEPIRRYGVLLDDATLRAEAMRLGITKTNKEALTPQQRVLAAQSQILKQTTLAQGDFARTADGVANKSRIQRAEIANTSAEIGTKLLPAYSKFLDVGLKVINFLAANIDIFGPLAAVIGVVVAAQWAWNIAMTANPIGLIIVGIAALVAAIVWIATKTTWFQTGWNKSWGAIKAVALGFWNWIKNLPSMIGRLFVGLANIWTAPFRAAFNLVARAWNNTIGKLSWTVPGWVPKIGGNTISAPHIPTFHQGGRVPGLPGSEMLGVLQAGETISPAGAPQRFVLELRSSGRRVDDLLLELLSRAIGDRGGRVDVVVSGAMV